MLYLYDTTLRDGAQGQSVTFSLQDKEQVIQRLDEVGMHFIEAGNPASNPKDAELYERMRTQPLKNAKLVAFGSTRRVGAEAHADAGLNVLANVGCQHVAIFGKSWDFHVREVLHTTLQENLNMIADSVRFLCQAGKTVFFDAEHFFDGYAANPRYAMETLQAASDAGAQFLVLCDTNGGTLPEDIALCAQAGFSAVELRKGTLLRYLRGGGTLEALRQTLEEQHVRAASLNALESISFQTKAGGRMLRELSEWCFAACRVLGCGCMEVIASFNVPEGISAAAICRETADSLLRLSDAAADYGVRLALEFMAVPGSSVRTFAQCAEILETVDRANVGMLLDTWHFCAGGSRPEELSALRGDRLFMVHVSDCPARAPFTAQRAESYWPGEGDAPLEELLRNVRAIGYDGPCSVEVMDPNVLALPAGDAIRRAAETMKPLLARVER